MSPNRHEPSGVELAALADAALAGDRAAAGELIARLNIQIGRYCRSRIGRSQGTFASADDVAQEALLAIYKALDTYRDAGEHFLAFAFGITKKKIADHYRKHGREQHAQLDEAPDVADRHPTPEVAAMRSELGSQVTNLINTLPVHQREVIYLRVAVGMSAEETAATISSTAGAVRVAQHRALHTLRKRLGGNEEEQ